MHPDTVQLSPPPIVPESGLSAAPLVLLGGAVTIVLALAGVWLAANAYDENVMGWYADYVLPVGALLVGLVASSGFGIASYGSGTKISGYLLVAVAALLIGGYWLAQYMEFRLAFPDGAVLANGQPAGFLDYYDAVTRSFNWVEHGKSGAPLGAFGYLLRVGEIVGFTGGGIIVPSLLRKVPYCETCRMYMRSRLVARIAAGIRGKKINAKRRPQEAQEQDERAKKAFEGGQAGLKAIFAAAAKDGSALAQTISEFGPPKAKGVDKLSARIWVKLVYCRRCHQGELRANLVTGQGQKIKQTPFSQTPVDRGIVTSLLQLPKRGQ
jgi:hypothetical protein